MENNERLEILGKEFKKDTGLLAPFKDAPACCGGDPEYNQDFRQREYDKWLGAKEKPPILSDGEIDSELRKRHFARGSEGYRQVQEAIKEIQRDADVEWHEAKIREIFEVLEDMNYHLNLRQAGLFQLVLLEKDWQSLKDKYMRRK